MRSRAPSFASAFNGIHEQVQTWQSLAPPVLICRLDSLFASWLTIFGQFCCPRVHSLRGEGSPSSPTGAVSNAGGVFRSKASALREGSATAKTAVRIFHRRPLVATGAVCGGASSSRNRASPISLSRSRRFVWCQTHPRRQSPSSPCSSRKDPNRLIGSFRVGFPQCC
jgi:hypothetical protein